MAFMTGFAQRATTVCRFLLLTGIAVVAALILTASPQQRAAVNPLQIGPASAAGGICAAPNYLSMTTMNGNNKFYVIDTNRKVICVYRIQASAIRLVAARKFDADERIWDSSLPLMNNKPLEGSDGATRDQASKYADDVQKLIETAINKKKP